MPANGLLISYLPNANDNVQDKLLPLPPCDDFAQLPLHMASAFVLSGTCCPMSLFTSDGFAVYQNQAAIEYMVSS